MGLIGGELAYRFLRWRYPNGTGTPMGTGAQTLLESDGGTKLDLFWGQEFFDALQGKRVADFGCGAGWACFEMAERGASQVIGLDIVDRYLEAARTEAERRNLSHRVHFVSQLSEKVDLVHSMDAFEHFMDPAAILAAMRAVVHDEGEAWISFGYTWYHPLGGHLFSVFPWAHLLFDEATLCRWRADFKLDGAKSFGEVEGGLNQMTIARWDKLVKQSPWRLERQILRPIRRLRWLHNRATREFLTSTLQVILKPR